MENYSTPDRTQNERFEQLRLWILSGGHDDSKVRREVARRIMATGDLTSKDGKSEISHCR